MKIENNEREFKLRVADKLGDLVENIIRQSSPYDSIPLHEEAASILISYYENRDKLTNDLKTRIINAYIAWGRHSIKQFLFGGSFGGAPFGKLYPQHMQAMEEFLLWLKSNISPVKQVSDTVTLRDKINKTLVNKVVKRTIKKRYPAYKVDNKTFGSIGYSCNWVFNNKKYILVDTGSWRESLSGAFLGQ